MPGIIVNCSRPIVDDIDVEDTKNATIKKRVLISESARVGLCQNLDVAMRGSRVYNVLVAPHLICREVKFDDFVHIQPIVAEEDMCR